MTEISIAALLALADRHLRAGALDLAISAFEAALQAEPGRPDAWFNLAWLYRAVRRFDDAIAAYGRAIDEGVARPEEAHLNRAVIFSDHLLRPLDAETELRAALAINPLFLPALLNLGVVNEDQGRVDDAHLAYQAALRIDPLNGMATARRAELDALSGDPAKAITELRETLGKSRRDSDRRDLFFVLGSILSSTGDHAAAFAAWTQGNAIAAQALGTGYNPAIMEALVSRIIAAYPAKIGSPAVQGQDDPIFICGMFRSGSTLFEQLIARHPDVIAGGENEYLPSLAMAFGDRYPERAAAMFDPEAVRHRQRYLEELRLDRSDRCRFTDKRCDNFLHIGLIQALFPQAVIVHTARQPLDTILSLFATDFDVGLNYTNRIEDIANYYVQYRRLMDHWKSASTSTIIDVRYDSLVVNPEGTLRPVVEKLGLAWDPACAHTDPALTAFIRTASVWQVRQPLYQRSSGRWKHYAVQLQPAITILEAAGIDPER